MEWVETTAKTVEEARELALDQLGVADEDAEFEVIEEPRPGLFGRLRGVARVRARVRPVQPRPKLDRRDRRRQGRSQRERSKPRGAPAEELEGASRSEEETPRDEQRVEADGARGPAASKRRRSRSGGRSRAAVEPGREEEAVSNVISVQEQAEVVHDFVEGLLEAFGYDAAVQSVRIDDETYEVRVEGEDLGLLVGPKGATLQAIQDVSRTVVQRQVPGTHEGRVRIDVAGYRERRRAALVRFTQRLAEEVRETGAAQALEPMSPADRKVVHDAVNELAGVRSTSEGEEPRRHVVILPDQG